MNKQLPLFDPDVLISKLADAMTPGFIAEFDPAEAEAAGAFEERALSEADALESAGDAVSLELFAMSDSKPFHVRVAEALIEQLKAGTAPWQRPWGDGVPTLPMNPVTGARYRGINTLQLDAAGPR